MIKDSIEYLEKLKKGGFLDNDKINTIIDLLNELEYDRHVADGTGYVYKDGKIYVCEKARLKSVDKFGECVFGGFKEVKQHA